MHMADALIDPAVGGAFWLTSAGLIGLSSRKVRLDQTDNRIPLMGVAGAFVFAAQMINFTIPGTGSSGHLGGGLLLAILLGPWAGFLTMASVLVIQSLFFADGGLLALGCNIFNLGFWTCFVAYPLVYKKLIRPDASGKRIVWAAVAAAATGLLLGAMTVVVQTVLSGISALPFTGFLAAMLPIHLAIGIIEGLVTAGVVLFVLQARPELITAAPTGGTPSKGSAFVVVSSLALAALVIGGVLSWFASSHPDGLEWSISRVTGQDELHAPQEGVHGVMTRVQEKTALMPDYDFRQTTARQEDRSEESTVAAWPVVDVGATVAGITGSLLTLGLIAGTSLLLRKKLQPAA